MPVVVEPLAKPLNIILIALQPPYRSAPAHPAHAYLIHLGIESLVDKFIQFFGVDVQFESKRVLVSERRQFSLRK